jgi:putative transposase
VRSTLNLKLVDAVIVSLRVQSGRGRPRSSTNRLVPDRIDFLGKAAPIITGGVDDHVHLLARFGRTITQAEWVKELKRVSNLWLKENYSIRDFEWQGGYADFSVSSSHLERVKNYIANQHKHPHKMNFQDELRTLLRRHHVEWDERYIWD